MKDDNNKIKFSVLMSVYYKEKVNNLKQSIESILNQTLMPNEIVIVKDGALPNDLDLCLEEYSNKYEIIKIVVLSKNLGLGKALSEGLKKCSYDYVARMDSDDISVKDRFEKQINYIYKHPNVDVLGGYIMEFDDFTGIDISIRKVPKANDNFLKFAKKRNPMNHVTVMFKKQSVIAAGNYMDCMYFEDYYLWARMIVNHMILDNIQEILVKVRAGKDMSSRRGRIKYIKYIFNFEKKLMRMKVINFIEFIYLIIAKSTVALLPNGIRYQIYQKRLRTKE